MAENEDPAEAVLRLEAALERIAQRAHKTGTVFPQPDPAGADTAGITARLDALIAQLRAALGAATGP